MPTPIVTDFSQISDSDLGKLVQAAQAERDQRARQAGREKEALRLERARRVFLVAKSLLPFMEHSRTSCSDENPSNGYTTAGRGGAPRCKKCFLMQLAEEDLPQVSLDVEFECAFLPAHPGYEG